MDFRICRNTRLLENVTEFRGAPIFISIETTSRLAPKVGTRLRHTYAVYLKMFPSLSLVQYSSHFLVFHWFGVRVTWVGHTQTCFYFLSVCLSQLYQRKRLRILLLGARPLHPRPSQLLLLLCSPPLPQIPLKVCCPVDSVP